MSSHRLDVATLYALLDAQRQSMGMSWRQVAAAVGSTPSAFTRMSHGRAPDARLLGSLLLWLGWAPELVVLLRPAEVER